MLEGPDAERLDLVRLRPRRLRERAVEPAAEDALQQFERDRGDGPTAAARARGADRTAFFEVECDQLDLGFLAAGAAVDDRVESLERQQLPEERGRDERVAALGERPQRPGEHP